MNERSKQDKSVTTLQKKLRSGLMLATLLLLTGCADKPSPNVKIIPDYKPEFLECVADEYDSNTHGQCTKKAVDDWSVIIEE